MGVGEGVAGGDSPVVFFKLPADSFAITPGVSFVFTVEDPSPTRERYMLETSAPDRELAGLGLLKLDGRDRKSVV